MVKRLGTGKDFSESIGGCAINFVRYLPSTLRRLGVGTFKPELSLSSLVASLEPIYRRDMDASSIRNITM